MLRRHRRGQAPDHGLDILSAGSPAGGTRGAHAASTITMTDAAELLAAPVTTDDLEAALAARPSRIRLPRLTVMLAAAVLIGGGFLAGVQVGKKSASASAGGLPAGLASGGLAGFIGARPSGGSPGGVGAPRGGSGAGTSGPAGLGSPGGGSGTFGTVKLVDGSTIYVQTVSGGIIRVTTSPSTKIQISATGTAKDLRPGQSVIVQGTKHGSGLVTATSVTESGLGTGGG
jgi:hypothetical protein